ncbi:MAG: hypothetical protein AAF605_09120, partial [Myxococcota bacterium]
QTVKLWDPNTGGLIHSYAHDAAVTSLAWFPRSPRSGEHRLVLGDESGTATILGTSSASSRAGFRGHASQRLEHLYTLG